MRIIIKWTNPQITYRYRRTIVEYYSNKYFLNKIAKELLIVKNFRIGHLNANNREKHNLELVANVKRIKNYLLLCML